MTTKGYSDRQMKNADESDLIEFSFPKHNPPVTIKARTREEAEKKLAALDKEK